MSELQEKNKKALARVIKFFTEFIQKNPEHHGKVEVNFHGGNVPSINEYKVNQFNLKNRSQNNE